MDLTTFDLNAARDAATQASGQRAGENLGAAVAQLTAGLQSATDGNPFLLEQLTGRLMALMPQLVSGLLNDQGVPQPTNQPPAGALGGNNTNSANTPPSEAEALGTKLLSLAGDNKDVAEQRLQFLETVTNADPKLLRYLLQTIEAVTRSTNPVQVVERGGNFHLAPDLAVLQAKNDLDTAFNDLVSHVHNGAAVAVAPPADTARDAKQEVDRLKANAINPDTFYTQLKAASGVTIDRNPGESFQDYAARVVQAVLINERAWVNRQVQLQASSGTETHDQYRTRLANALQASPAYFSAYDRLTRLLSANGVTVDQDRDTVTTMVNKLVQHVNNGRLGARRIQTS